MIVDAMYPKPFERKCSRMHLHMIGDKLIYFQDYYIMVKKCLQTNEEPFINKIGTCYAIHFESSLNVSYLCEKYNCDEVLEKKTKSGGPKRNIE